MKTSNRKRNCRIMSQISKSKIEDIMIEIHIMNLNETKDMNPIGHIRGPNKVKEEYQETFGKQYKILKYEPKETKIEQLGNTRIYLDIVCQKD